MSKDFLSASALQLYSLDVTLSKFTENCCRKLIAVGKDVLAYLLVHFEMQNSEGPSDALFNYKNASSTKSHTIKALHECRKSCVETLENVAVSGVLDTTANAYKVKLYLLFSSYVADIPWTEDLLRLNRGFQTVMCCPICFAKSKNFNSCADAGNRNLQNTSTILENCQNLEVKRDAESTLSMLSMHVVAPVLHTFPFAGTHFCVDLYSRFRPEPMLVFRYSQILEGLSDWRACRLWGPSSAVKDSEKKEGVNQ